MSHKIHKSIFIGNIIFILFGSLFLGWYYFIDGKIINKPLSFPGTDILMFELDKESYKVGETPELFTTFCKNRDAVGTVEWTLIDGQKVSYRPKAPSEVPIGCYPENGGKIKAPIERIPIYIEDTCDAFFTGVGRVEISGGREVIYKYKTEKFCIEASRGLISATSSDRM